MSVAESLSSVAVAALVTAMVSNENSKQDYVLVVGLGVTGLSVVRHLYSQGADIIVVDSRQHPPGLDQLKKDFPEVPIYMGAFDEALFLGAQQLIVSPGVPIMEPVIQQTISQGIDVIGDIELFAQQVKAPVVAITGSNGKSTVTTLVGEMAKQAGINVAIGGNLGVPALELLQKDVELYVLELSSFQLETVSSLQPIVATVLNVSPDHMDRYIDFDHYAKVKQHIYKHCKTAIVNRDDRATNSISNNDCLLNGFTLNEPGPVDFGLREFDGEAWLCKGDQKLIAEQQLKLGGRHNTANALAALALGDAAGIDMTSMLTALEAFAGLAHRTQWVAEKANVTWYNDSKGTNVGATLAAIEGLSITNKIILIAGGLAKDADFQPLQSIIKQKVRLVVLMGQDAPKIEQALDGVVPTFYATTMDDAVHIAADLAHPGDSVLLSPACASFDMFNGYEHRGEMFIAAVEALS